MTDKRISDFPAASGWSSGAFIPQDNPSGITEKVSPAQVEAKLETDGFVKASGPAVGDVAAYGVSGWSPIKIANANVASGAAIAWSKVSKSGAVASDVGALPVANPTATGVLTAPVLKLNTDQGAFPTSPNSVFYNESEDTVNIVRADGSTLSVGQENTFKMKNGSGGDLIDGQIVRISGAVGANALVALADANTHTGAMAIGMVTQPIANNATGNVATSISVVNGLNTNAYAPGTELFLSETPGAFTSTAPSKPKHRVSIGYVVRQHASQGSILFWVNPHDHIGDLNDVDTTGIVNGQVLEKQSDSVWRPTSVLKTSLATGKYWSGFYDPDGIVESYDETARTVTITHSSGFIRYVWQGVEQTPIASPWVTPAHSATTGQSYYYYSTDGVTFAWSTTVWTFKDVMVAAIRKGSSLVIPIRECHGLMDPDVHESLHRSIWTRVRSGGTLTAGTYAIGGTASDANNTPGVDSVILMDEDLPTSLSALTQGSYRVVYPASGEFGKVDQSFPFPYTAAGFINYYPTDTPSQGATGKFYNVYLVAAPTMSASHANRFIWLAPQAEYASLTAAQGEAFEALRLGDLATGTSEYVPIYRLVYGSSSSHSSTGKVRLEAADLLSRSVLRSTSTAVSPLSGSGTAGEPTYWASPTSLTSESAANFIARIGALGVTSPSVSSGRMTLAAATAGAASLRIPSTSTRPTAPSSSDIWSTTSAIETLRGFASWYAASDTFGAGSRFEMADAISNTKGWTLQLGASNTLDFWNYAPSVWTRRIQILSDGNLKLLALAGTGTRDVFVDSAGQVLAAGFASLPHADNFRYHADANNDTFQDITNFTEVLSDNALYVGFASFSIAAGATPSGIRFIIGGVTVGTISPSTYGDFHVTFQVSTRQSVKLLTYQVTGYGYNLAVTAEITSPTYGSANGIRMQAKSATNSQAMDGRITYLQRLA